MKKYLAYYETEWPANIAELTAVENKPFVGYLKDSGVQYTVIPKPVTGPADNEIWYTSSDGATVTPQYLSNFGAGFVENVYEDGKGILRFNGPVTYIPGNTNSRAPVINLNGAFRSCSSLTSIIIPDSVTSIGSAAFMNCSSLTSVTIGNSVTSIVDQAFESCSSLTSIIIPDSVTSIGSAAFMNCSSLTSVTIGNSVTRIGGRAFRSCSSLTSVTIPNSVTSIGERAFSNCSSLTSITFEGTMEQWNTITKESYWNDRTPATYVQCTDGQVLINGIWYTTSDNQLVRTDIHMTYNIINHTYENGKGVIEFDSTINSIPYRSFYSCSSLTSITIPNSVTSIQAEAFGGCSSLASITFEGTVDEWNAIEKRESWNSNTLATYVQCNDGQVAL